jgi:outer membrane protein OmpA-like peptidoglycan-associated protein
MMKGRQASLRAALAVAGTAAAGALLLDGAGLVPPAQAQNAEERKKREQERNAPPRVQQQPKPMQQPPSRVTQPPPQRQLPPPERTTKPLQDKPFQNKSFQEQKSFQDKPFKNKTFQKEPPPSRPVQQVQPPPGQKAFQPKPLANPESNRDLKPDGTRRFTPPGQPGIPPSRETQPKFQPAPSGPGPARPLAVTPGTQDRFKRVDDIKKFRLERVEDGGRRKVIEEPGRRFIVKEHNRTIVRHDETDRFLRRPGAKSQRRPDGTVETFYVRRDGVRVFTVVDGNGRLLRRFRRDRDGREHHIIDNRRFWRNVALGVGLGIVVLNLPPPRITIPYDDYIVDYDDASDDDLYETLDAPPVEDLDRSYSLEEIRDNYPLLARVRSIDIDSIQFDTGSWEIAPDEYDKLERIARAILRVLERNPDSVLMIAGHTDAVGPEDENASLSDRRATAVAEVLTDRFEVPAENIVTQGYGEQQLKVDTQGPEPRNRRVSVHNVTGLMAER